MNICLGYEIGTGAPVEIPLRHMAVTGQTQEAGKTTALEALISRAGLQAVTFVTKRGEGAFTDARPIDSYRSLWEHINGAGSWDANPWVVAVTFRPERRNIDA